MMTLASSGEMTRLTFPGKVRASQRVDMAFQVSGTLIELPIKEGAQVKEGDLLAQIDPKDFQTNLRKAEGQLARGEASIERAQSDYDRILRIRKKDPGAMSQAMVDQKREAMDSAKADIKSLEASVDGAKDQLSYTSLHAPFSGVIAKRYVDNFQEVRAVMINSSQSSIVNDVLGQRHGGNAAIVVPHHIRNAGGLDVNAGTPATVVRVARFAHRTGTPDHRDAHGRPGPEEYNLHPLSPWRVTS